MTIGRKVKCNHADCPHEKLLKFSDWVREKLPDSNTGYRVTDIDFVFFNEETKKIIIVEQKTRGTSVPSWQRDVFINLKYWISGGLNNDWKFEGIHLLQFENYFFDDGKAYFDNKQVTEKELIYYLSLNY